MPPNRLPSLNAIKAFEAAARFNSLTLAADNLCVSTAAVSQQVKMLEEYLGVQLFRRTNKGLEITSAGELYYPLVLEGFDKLRLASRRLQSFKLADRLTISVLPSMASHWLGNHLFEWCNQNPESQVNIMATHNEVDFVDTDVDFRICYGYHAQRNVLSDKLLNDYVTPVCSPELAQRIDPTGSPSQINTLPRLNIDWGGNYDTLPSWADWFEAANMKTTNQYRGPSYNLSSMAIQAAIKGQGVILGQGIMVKNDISSNRLVKLFDITVPLRESYYIMYTKDTLQKPHAMAFLNWLKELSHEHTGL